MRIFATKLIDEVNPMIEKDFQIAISSKKNVFIFKLLKDHKLSYDTYDSDLHLLENKVLYDEGVICYDLCIDEEDSVHLVSLLDSGELNYIKFLDGKWSGGIIGKFDLTSNIYNQIEILFIKNKLHIIYNLSNYINSNVWTIQHVIYGDKIEGRHNITRYISSKKPEYFVVDIDSDGIIHLAYNPNIDKSQIFHCFYNPFSNKWSSKANKLSQEGRLNYFPYLLVDTKDNIHLLWLESYKNNYNIKYLKMNAEGRRKHIWKEINLPAMNVSKYPPIIFEEGNIIKLAFTVDSQVKLLNSNDYGDSWVNEEEIYHTNENLRIIKCRSNIDSKINRINYSYCETNNNIKLYILEMFKKLPIIQKDFNLEDQSDKNELLVENEDTDITPDMYYKLGEKLDNILENQSSIEEIMTKILKYQEFMDIKLDDIYEFTETDNRSFIERLFHS